MIVNAAVALGLAPVHRLHRRRARHHGRRLGRCSPSSGAARRRWATPSPPDARLRRALPRILAACASWRACSSRSRRCSSRPRSPTAWLRYPALAGLVALGMASYAAAALATGGLRPADIRAAMRRPPRRERLAIARHAADRHHRRRPRASPSSSAPSPTGCACRRSSAICSPASLIGPFTPGFVADQALAAQLAEIGVILLMFGVGLHFSLDDLLAVRAIAVPGAIGQIAVATAARHGPRLRCWAGRSARGLVFGLALSVASTVVLLRALQERRHARHRARPHRRRLADRRGPGDGAGAGAAAGAGRRCSAAGAAGAGARRSPACSARASAITLGKVGAFVALMLVGRPAGDPLVLHAGRPHRLARAVHAWRVLAIALGVAFGSAAAVRRLLRARRLLRRHGAERIASSATAPPRRSLPLRDAFAVLFFVSVGMLFDPAILVAQPLRGAGHVLIIVVGKSRRRLRHRAAPFGYPLRHGADGLGQPGADRRVLLHPRRPRRRASACCRRRRAT